jgi:hypothetical protein
MEEKRKVAVVMFTPTAREARVMRQVMALRDHYEVTVLGMGRNPFEGDEAVTFVELPADSRSLPAKLLRRAVLYATVAGKVIPWLDTWRHSRRPCWQRAFKWLMENRQDLLIAHEPETAALAAGVKARHGTKVILDLHEYSPRESDTSLQFRLIKGPLAVRTLRRWGRKADATLTVNEHFCDLYVESCGIPRPVAIHNAPARLPEPRPARLEDGRIHLIHHGVCSPARELHLSIEALKTAPEHIVLHFMFADANPQYLARLEAMAAELPGRVFFEEPVDYTGILPAIARYHAGLYYIPNNTFNHTHALANKFFDFLCAGLPLITGPNVGTAKYTRQNGFGWVTEDYTAAALSKVLHQLTPESIAAAAVKADEFSRRMNAVTEHEKLLRLTEELLA